MHNSSDHEVYKLTKDMYDETEKILRDYKNAQLLLKENEPKSLRGKSESAETEVTRKEEDQCLDPWVIRLQS